MLNPYREPAELPLYIEPRRDWALCLAASLFFVSPFVAGYFTTWIFHPELHFCPGFWPFC